MEGLTRKQKVFVEQYLITWNATKAARLAGYTYPDRQGYRLLRYVEIRAAIEQRMSEVAMSADEVLARLSEQARVDISDFVEGEGEMITVKWDAIRDRGHLVKSIKPVKEGVALELHDPQVALMALARKHALLVDRQEGTHRFAGNYRVVFDGSADRAGDPDTMVPATPAEGTAGGGGTGDGKPATSDH